MSMKQQNIAFAVGTAVFVGGIALSRYNARKLKKNQARLAMYDRWIETIENLDMASPTAHDDIEFWNIIVQNEIKK